MLAPRRVGPSPIDKKYIREKISAIFKGWSLENLCMMQCVLLASHVAWEKKSKNLSTIFSGVFKPRSYKVGPRKTRYK